MENFKGQLKEAIGKGGAYIEIPFKPYKIKSCKFAVSASFPQTPLIVHPCPFAVCSHW